MMQYLNKKADVVLLVLITIIMATVPANSSGISPVQQDKFTAISSGADGEVLALTEDGNVWAWGRIYGDISDPSYSASDVSYHSISNRSYYRDQMVPVQVPISNVISISTNGPQNFALKKDGTVWAWGYNEYGGLGDGTNVSKSVPVQVINLDTIIAISGSVDHTIALKSDGTVWAWGYNAAGELGDGTFENRNTPVQVKGLDHIKSISGGSFAIKDDGTVWTWGMTLISDKDGYIDNNGSVSRCQALSKPTPFQIPSISNVVGIDADNMHAIFIKDDGTVWCWGYDAYGQLGNGGISWNNWMYKAVPVQAKGLSDIKQVVACPSSSIALKKDGTVWIWGSNGGGQLGTGDTGGVEPVPIKVKGLDGVIAISCKSAHSVFLKDDGSIWMSGADCISTAGYEDMGESFDTPTKVLWPDNTNNTVSSITPSVMATNGDNASGQSTISKVTQSPPAETITTSVKPDVPTDINQNTSVNGTSPRISTLTYVAIIMGVLVLIIGGFLIYMKLENK